VAMVLQETTLRLLALMQLVLSIARRKKRRTAVATSGCTELVVPLLVLQVAPCSCTNSVSG
jgi:hypothetical protein